ncbi:formate dehydrogenase subunit alpha [Aeromonas enteropelogenes]|uniref:formate dehydrogenase subunit alpha n=1 Tax=Aeromonas enteropelogenes TaxID=29489 RepID=UPI0022865E71|nr:formate dehydrogenase subunit alpha [Aeromonas enteropelogenes]MCZ0752507.1 formate dehydrogenase subunit alpha [Aeromonas enteropelogenes]
MLTLTLDGAQLTVDPTLTLLQIAKQHHIDIPSLCGDNDRAPKTPCDLCVVEIAGVGIRRACETRPSEGMVVTTQSQALRDHRQQALGRILSDHYADCEAPCQRACPAGVDIQSYLHHIAMGDHEAATAVIKQTLPMPLSIGRVCPAFCEAECRRSLVDEPLAIRQLKRHAADLDLAGMTPYHPPKKPAKGKRVAIIGSGPGGLTCGYYLGYEGFDVDLFEAMPEAGGWLRYGIPEYRLPKAILDQEIALMCESGMRIHTSQRLGQELSLSALCRDYDAVCLAVGASQAVPMEYPGSTLEGCYLGVDYLKDRMLEQRLTTGKRVAVIGGGNTAIDCARTAVRLGAETTLIYRRTRAEMPAEAYEIDEAEHEGVRFLMLTNPVENLADEAGRVCQVRLEKMALGEPDASGRRRPEPTGEFIVEEFDTVIAAVSQRPDLSFMEGESLTLPLTRWNTLAAHPDPMHSGPPTRWARADRRGGRAPPTAAVADGRKAALAIDHFLHGTMVDPVRPFNASKAPSLKQVDPVQFAHLKKVARAVMPHLAERSGSFAEVEQGFSDAAARAEAARCLECGCQANTDCALRDYATEYKVDQSALDTHDGQKFAVDNSSEFIVFDANRCIGCGQCVQACNEQAVQGILQFARQADGTLSTRPQFEAGLAMGDSHCVQCGACVQVCPTGAMVDARDKSQGRTELLTPVNTICTYCGVGCGVTLYVDEARQRIRYVEGNRHSPVNQGLLCVKGRFGFDFIQSEERLTTPLIRKDGQLVPASWQEAIALVAERFGAIKAEHGSDALAGFSSAKTTNEDNYLFQKFMRRELATNNVDHCARLCHASTVTGLEASLGSGAMTNDIPSIDHSDLIFIIGSDTSAAHPIIGSHIKRVVREGKARLVVADPKRIEMADHASLYLAHRPGTDVMLLNGIMQQIIRHDWHDKSYIAERVEGFETLKAEVLSPAYAPDKVALITGVPAEQVIELARLIGTAERTAIYYSMGITQHTTGHDNVRAIANLQLLCGNIGIEGGGINPLRGQSNVQGACDMGALPNNFPGYQKVADPDVHARFVAAWQAPWLPTKPGLTLTETIDAACAGTIKGLYVMGENPVLSDPDQHHVIEGLKRLEFLVVQDIFLSETAQLADVVLPSCSFAEKSGHFTNTERRVQRLSPAIKAPGQAREDWWIIQQLANAMGGDWHYQNVAEITEEICRVTPQYAGIHWDKVGQAGLQWPCHDQAPEGTRLLHGKQFTRGKGEMVATPFRYAAELPDETYPIVLTTGRLLEQFHTGTMTRKTRGLDKLAGPRVMMSVVDAERLGIGNSERVKVTSRRGHIELPAFVTKRMQPGVVFIPFHFAEAPANRLTINATDPHAKIPEFKVAAVRIDKLATPANAREAEAEMV